MKSGGSSPRNGRIQGSREWLWLAAVLLVACLVAWPAMSQPGLLNTRGGGDSPFLLQRLHQLTAALADGHFPVRWMPDANYGYGYPFYNYYAPLSIYVAAAFRFLGFSFVRAIQLAQLAGFVVAGLGMFYLGRRWLRSPWAGLLAAVAYTVAPFHMVNVYVRGDSLAEFWAMAFYPLVLLAADGVLERVRESAGVWGQGNARTISQSFPRFPLARPIALFALAYAALILSHNISALIFSPFLLLYLGLRLILARKHPIGEVQQQSPVTSSSLVARRSSLVLLLALFLAFALAAWFFVPALAEQDLAQLGPVTEGYFHYSNHFRGLDLIQVGLLFDYNPDGGVAFRLGLVQVVLAIGGAVALIALRRLTGTDRHSDRRDRPPDADRILYVLIGALIAVFMVTPLSRPLWDHLPLLPFAQFPWRFLSIAAFFTSLLAGAVILVTDRPVARAAITVLGSLILLTAGLLGLRPDFLTLTDADVTAERLAQYEWFTGNIGTTVSAEYLTPESIPRPWTSAWLNTGERHNVVALAGELTSASLIKDGATRQDWALDVGRNNTTLLFPTMNWPNWLEPLDSYSVTMDTQPGSGLMSRSQFQSGKQTIGIGLRRTPIRLISELLSCGAWLMIALLFVMGGRPSSASLKKGLMNLTGMIVFIVLFALLWRDDARNLPPGDLTWDFAQMAYLHHDVGGVSFDNGARLHQYGYSAEEIAAGETLTVTLSVDPGDGSTATLALVTPASARPTPDGAADPPAIAAAIQPLDGESSVFTLPIPADAPPGLYVPRLTIDDARPMMPSGATRGDLFLRPVRVSGGTGDAGAGQESGSSDDLQSPIPPSSTLLDVRALTLAMRDATTLDGRFAWYTARPLGARYQFSWRLQDPAGGIMAQLDAQPGYGYQPSTLWPAERWTADWLALRLPDVAPAEGEYPLVMHLYDLTTGDTVLMRRVGTVSWDGSTWRPNLYKPSFLLPDNLTPVTATFGSATDPTIALRGYQLKQETDALRLTLYWEALNDPVSDYTRFVHLIDDAGNVASQVDSAPAADSYPPNQWVEGEIVTDSLAFDLASLPAGEYRLVTGFYRPKDDLSRLPAFGPDGPLPDDRVFLPESITIP